MSISVTFGSPTLTSFLPCLLLNLFFLHVDRKCYWPKPRLEHWLDYKVNQAIRGIIAYLNKCKYYYDPSFVRPLRNSQLIWRRWFVLFVDFVHSMYKEQVLEYEDNSILRPNLCRTLCSMVYPVLNRFMITKHYSTSSALQTLLVLEDAQLITLPAQYYFSAPLTKSVTAKLYTSLL